MATAEVTVTVTMKTEIDAPLRAYLVTAGWTPPGEEPIPDPEHRRVLAEELTLQEQRIRKEYSAHGRHDGCITWDDHIRTLHERGERVRREARTETRIEVAEEIAKDLDKPRAWRITADQPSPWAAVARAHAKGIPPAIYWTEAPRKT